MREKAYIGRSLSRHEDLKLLRGMGQYTADIPLDSPLHICFVRAQLANARIDHCRLEAAKRAAGVHAVYCGKDVSGLGALSVNNILDSRNLLPFPILAEGCVHAVGQPLAAVLAETANQAADAAEAIDVALTPLGANPSQLGDGGQDPLFSKTWKQGDVKNALKTAPHHVEVQVSHPRISPVALETRSIAVSYDGGNDAVTVWLSTQTPHRAKRELCSILDLDPNRLSVIAPDVGGAFGMKASLYPEEVFAVWASVKLRRDVRWVASRSEDFISASHGRGARSTGKLAFDRQGKFLALIADIVAPIGSWMTNSCQIPAWNAARILPGPYAIENFELQTRGIHSPTAPVGIYRGAGRPEAAMVMEQLVEKAASVLHMDPVALRQKNLVLPDQMPFARATGARLDSGDYPKSLARLTELAGYDALRANQARRRAQGEWVGIGLALFVEPCGTGWESACVELRPEGRVLVRSGSSSQGHGRATAYAQIAADALQCDIEAVTVTFGDTRLDPEGIGALASRSTAIGGSAVWDAAKKALKRAGGSSWPMETTQGSSKYFANHEAWGNGAYLAQVAIEPQTGELTLESLFCIDDAGTLINPGFVEAQILGGIAQGIGEATLEILHYTGDGQLLTGSLMDYGLPRASQIPPVTLAHMQTPSDSNLLGAKGIGEAGIIGAPAAIYNAVIDALSPLNIDRVDLPLTSNNLWNAMNKAKTDGN